MVSEEYHKIFAVGNGDFEAAALQIFRRQAADNPVYKAYLQALGIQSSLINSVVRIPFLPVSFFKTHEVKTGEFEPQAIFESSGTTVSINSRHYVKDLLLYEQSFTRGFEFNYGPVTDWCIIGLLPSYLERKNSSLVNMVNRLIQLSGHPQSGFYLDEYAKLTGVLQELEKREQPTLLIGVTFALLDLADKFPMPLRNTIIMETGGMKGRREEMIRAEVYDILKKAFGVPVIHSEYGMTELLSQAYSKKDGIFYCPPWMKVLIRDEEDPLLVKRSGTGAINIIDLANMHSCSFIASDDIGKLNHDGSFEVLGRMDGSDLRGCSLMIM